MIVPTDRCRFRPRLVRLENRDVPAHVAVGPEFRVNLATAGSQKLSGVATDAEGDFVVTWGSESTIYARRFDSEGVAQGTVITVGGGDGPSVAMTPAGSFVISWTASGFGAFARRYDPTGNPLGSAFMVSSGGSDNDLSYSGCAIDSAGNFVVTWSSFAGATSLFDSYARRYDANGIALGAPFRTHTSTIGIQLSTGVAMDSDGDFAITWQSNGGDGLEAGVYARRYSASGMVQGPDFLVNSYTTNYQYAPGIAMSSTGEFVIAWSSHDQDGSGEGVFAQRFNSNGLAIGTEFQINTFTTGNQGELIRARCDLAGNFMIVWRSDGQDGDGFGIYARSYDAQGAPLGPEFQVNTYSAQNQTRPALAMAPDGDAIICWGSQFQDGDSYGIYAQRYTNAPIPQVQSITVNNGDAQRSRIASMTITFNSQVTFAGPIADAFALSRTGGGAIAFTTSSSVVNGVTVVTLNNFTGPETEFGSLRDGRYTLTALASQISAGGQPMAANYTFNFHRYYGDMNGDARVDISDFGFFSLAYLTPLNYNAALDFNNDGRIDISDFGQFSVRFFTTLP